MADLIPHLGLLPLPKHSRNDTIERLNLADRLSNQEEGGGVIVDIHVLKEIYKTNNLLQTDKSTHCLRHIRTALGAHVQYTCEYAWRLDHSHTAAVAWPGHGYMHTGKGRWSRSERTVNAELSPREMTS